MRASARNWRGGAWRGLWALATAGMVLGSTSRSFGQRSLREHFGTEAGERLLNGLVVEERLRGIDRLAAQGTDEALEVLLEAFVDGGALRADSRTRLAATRALAPHAALPEVASALAEVLSGDGSEGAHDRLVRRVAARALARAGTEDTTTTLLVAILSGGAAAPWAEEALLADPPPSLAPFEAAGDVMPTRTIELLGRLGDARAVPWLEAQYDLVPQRGETDPGGRRRAAKLALARLGVVRALDPPRDRKGEDDVPEDAAPVVASEGLDEDEGDDDQEKVWEAFAQAEAEILLGAPTAAASVAALLGKAKTRRRAFELAERLLAPTLVPTLRAVLGAKVTPGERAVAARILARIGDDGACRVLAGLLNDPALATAAALGLAQSPSRTARVSLERALAATTEGPPRRLALRAGIVRALVLGERIAGLGEALEAARAHAEPADRAVGVFGLVALGDLEVTEVGDTEVEVAAAGRGAIARGPATWSDLSSWLAPEEGSEEPLRWVAGGAALLAGNAGRSPRQLLAVAEAGGVLAPLATLRVAATDSGAHRPRLDALLTGADPVVRAHGFLGLGHSPEPTASIRLAQAYRFEADPMVRGAILIALSRRTEPQRTRALRLARDWDPERALRARARRALAGHHVDPTQGHARRVAWLTLRPSEDGARDAIAGRPVAIVSPQGLAWTAVSAPDGVLLVPAAGPGGDVRLRLAPRTGSATPPVGPAPPAPLAPEPEAEQSASP